MFTRISALLAVAIAVAASARMERHVLAHRDNAATGQCNTGELSCCNVLSNASNHKDLLDMLSMQYQESDNVGFDCIPFNIAGAGQSASCKQQPVCCSNNHFNGFVNIGCSPVDFD